MSKVSGSEEQIDVRVSSLPGLYQLSLVLRFLHGYGGARSLADLGMSEYDRVRVSDVLAQQSGCVLVTGPTGSGKTTTLYAMLDILNTGANKIITLENPVEYQLSGVQQSQINEAKGYSYEKGLKAILRHDPDIILVGETRSNDTAQTMITASLTGHMVFTTLHTQRALESITRLLSMGVEAYLLAPSLKLICGQRLVRKLCTQCANHQMQDRQSGMRAVTAAEKEEMQVLIDNIKKSRPNLAIELPTMLPCAVGCEHCQGTGYRGRTVIMETLLVTDEMRDLLLHGQDEQQLLALARKNGFLTMEEDGLLKVLAGETTWEEVKRSL